jgi:hypothetical protein
MTILPSRKWRLVFGPILLFVSRPEVHDGLRHADIDAEIAGKMISWMRGRWHG